MKKIYAVLGLSMLALPGIAFGAPSSTPTEVLGTVADNGINSAVSLVGTIMTTYFPYLIAIVAGLALLRWVWRFAKAGT